MFFILNFYLCFIALAESIELTEDSLIPDMFPSDKVWKNNKVAKETSTYFEALYSNAFFRRECEHETELRPIYYFSGDTVKIECFMCNIAHVFNGAPKSWGRVRNIDDFIRKGERFGSTDGPEIEILENNETDDNKSNGTLEEPWYYQEEGFLFIEKANVNSQGVYFCRDEDSAASQRFFYVLIPILPVVSVSRQHIDHIDEISNGCSDSPRKFPSHTFKESDVEQEFDDQDTCFSRKGADDWSCFDSRKSVRFPGCENPGSLCRSPFTAPTLPLEIPLSISLQWGQWSGCQNKRQTRTGQCYFSLDRQLFETTPLPKKWEWLRSLSRLTDNIAFREGIPLFSGILAGWLYGVDHLRSCLDTDLGENATIDGYNDFYSNVFSSMSPNSTDEMEIPKNAFKYCIRHEQLDGIYDALVGTYTKDERTC